MKNSRLIVVFSGEMQKTLEGRLLFSCTWLAKQLYDTSLEDIQIQQVHKKIIGEFNF